MPPFLAELVGYAASVVGFSLMLPQVVKILRTRKVRDLSWGMLWLYLVNCALWLAYGILIGAMPVIACNALCLVVSVVQLWLKAKFEKS